MFRTIFVAATLIAAPLALASAAGAERGGQRCEPRRHGGGLIGGIARGAIGHFGGGTVVNMLPVASMLGDALINLLNCEEQRKAATATQEAVSRGEVGTTSAWRSESRPGVRGTSTVTAVEPRAPDGECMTVTDVVIVDGEETRAPKRMCRRPPTNRYVRV